MKNSNETIGIQNRNLPTCSAMTRPTGLPRAPDTMRAGKMITSIFLSEVTFLLSDGRISQ
jgi:hypothetical protein